MGRYEKDEKEVPMSSEDYLLYLDRKLGLPAGTIYEFCKVAKSGKPIERDECRVTYKGLTSKFLRVGAGHFIDAPKKVFLIEGSKTDQGRKVLA